MICQLPDSWGGTILNTRIQVLSYADDVAGTARNKRTLEENYVLWEEKARKLGFEVNISKTKYMKMEDTGGDWGEKSIRINMGTSTKV